MSRFNDIPSQSIVPPDVWMEDDAVRRALLRDIAEHIVDKYVDLSTEFKDPTSSQPATCTGTVLEYSRKVLSLGLFYLERRSEAEGPNKSDYNYIPIIILCSVPKSHQIVPVDISAQQPPPLSATK